MSSSSESVVRITWDGGLPWVSIQNNWREHTNPRGLAEQVVAEYGRGHGPVRHVHRPPAPKGDLHPDVRRELRALRHEYVEARRLQRSTGGAVRVPVTTTSATGVTAQWVGGGLGILEFDPDWLERVGVQGLCDTLTELLSNPPEVEAFESPAVRRAIENLERFGARHG